MRFWQDKVVLVTGGSSGLGRVIAEAVRRGRGQAGHRRPGGRGRPARRPRKCKPPAATRLGIQADITRQDDVDRLFGQASARFGRLDVLVNNAGRSMRGKVLDTTPEQFRDLMELNLLGLVRCTRAAVPHLLTQRGHVVNIGSLAAKSAARWVGAYPATKHAVAAYSQQLRLELGPRGAARAAGLSGSDRSGAIRGCIRWKGWKTCRNVPASRAAGVKTRPIPPQRLGAGDSSGVPASSAGVGRSRPRPVAVRHCPALARLGDWIVLRKT